MMEEVLGNAFVEHVTFDGACIIICVRYLVLRERRAEPHGARARK